MFLHGWSAESNVWGDFADIPGRESWLFDMPGHGDSPWTPGFTLNDLAQAILDTAPAGADHVGWSLGGVTSLACATLRPAAVRSVAILAMSSFGGERSVRMRNSLAADRTRALMEFYRLVWSPADRRQPHFAELQRDLARKRRIPTTEAMVGLYDAVDAGRAGLDLDAVTCPVTVIHGTDDAISPLARAQEIASRIRGATVVPIPGAGHVPFLSFPDATRAALDSFWKNA